MLRALLPEMRDDTPRTFDPKAALTRFCRSEDGTMMVFGLMLLMLMLAFGGMAVDIMRFEQRRTALQQTIDRSVLAAASLSQTRDPEAVVNDYFDKAGLAPYLKNVTVTDARNARIVDATAEAELPTFFMGMLGFDKLDVPAAAIAEQQINNVEIVMVLDVSGSMSGAKIANLKVAAKNFVDTVTASDTAHRISITIVPYNAQVNLPLALREKYNASSQHGIADINCLEIPSTEFDSASLSRTNPIPMASFADTTSTTTTGTSYTTVSAGAMVPSNAFCRLNNDNLVRLMSDDADTIKARIDAMDAGGNTSIVLGMKWGLALIDPASRPMLSELIDEGEISADFAGRPASWTDRDTMKVIIVMTDGEHVAHNQVNAAFKTGLSPIWKSGNGYYSIQHSANRPAAAGTNTFYVPHLGTWQAGAFSSGGATQQTWQQVWQSQRLSWVAWQLYARALGTTSATRTSWYNTTMNGFRSTYMEKPAMDAALSQTCTQAKDKGVVVYGIAFEAPASGQAVIQDCATSPAYYFDPNGPEIASAFNAIASNISQLRLTQ